MSPSCFFLCAHLEHSIMKIKDQHRIASSDPEVQPSNKTMELILNISLRSGSNLRECEYLALLLNKIEESSGSLHLCCRDLEIHKLGDSRNTMNHLDLQCLDHLSVFQGWFWNCVSQLRCMDHLNELSLYSFAITDHVETVLR